VIDPFIRMKRQARYQWLMPTILATQKAEIRRMAVRSQPRQVVLETVCQKNPFTHTHTQKGEGAAGGVAEGVGPEFKLHIT
jgi:hypothetical protein